MDVLDQRTPVARKTHECDLCHCEIERGERYRVGTYSTIDHGVYRFRTHEDCSRIGERMVREWRLDEGYRDEDLMEWLFGGNFDDEFFNADDRTVRERIQRRRALRATS